VKKKKMKKGKSRGVEGRNRKRMKKKTKKPIRGKMRR